MVLQFTLCIITSRCLIKPWLDSPELDIKVPEQFPVFICISLILLSQVQGTNPDLIRLKPDFHAQLIRQNSFIFPTHIALLRN